MQDISFLDVDRENKETQMKLRLSEPPCSFPEIFLMLLQIQISKTHCDVSDHFK